MDIYMEPIPMVGAQLETERYRFDHTGDQSGVEPDMGVVLKMNGGVGLVDGAEVPKVYTGVSAVTSLGYNHENLLGRFQYDGGRTFNDGNGLGNLSSTMGIRGTFGMTFLPSAGVEAGYRFNSRGKNHPYIGADLSMHVYTIGLVGGFTLNPNNIGEDRIVSTTCVSQGNEDPACRVRENAPLWNESTLFLGVRAGFR